MGIADLKKQARALEQSGDAAAAITIYDEILGELERLALKPDGALYVKVGDLALKTGQRSRAVSLFERAAEEYARDGSHKAVTALCLKILRTNPRRKDLHIKYGRLLLGYGHLDATRQVLLDYAERTGLEKTRNTLKALSERSEAEQRAKLGKFFEMAERAAPQSGEPPAVAAPRPSAPLSQTTEHLAIMVESVREEPIEAATVAPVEAIEQEPAQPADPIVAAIMAKPSAEPPKLPEPVESVEPEPEVAVLSVSDGGQTGESTRDSSPFNRVRNALKSRRMWPWPAAAAAVLVLGVGLMGFGAIPFGGNLDADQPTVSPMPIATIAVFQSETIDTLVADDAMMLVEALDSEAIDGSVSTVQTAEPQKQEPRQPVAPAAPAQPSDLDASALESVSNAALNVDAAVDVALDPTIGDDGKITVPVSVPSRLAAASPRTPTQSSANRRVIVIEGLEIVGLAGSSEDYKIVQRLASGKSVTLTVIPFANAPAGSNMQVEVQAAPGNAATGSRRFRDFYIVVEAPVAPSTLEDLLDKLEERSWR